MIYSFSLFLVQVFIEHLLALYSYARNGGHSSKQNRQYFILYWGDNQQICISLYLYQVTISFMKNYEV